MPRLLRLRATLLVAVGAALLIAFGTAASPAVTLAAAPAAAQTAAQERPLPDFDSFAAQVKIHLQTDEERQSGYVFEERRTEERIDGDGRVTSTKTRVYEVFPGLPGEDRYRRLIEEDGRAIAAPRLAQQDRDRQQDVATYTRRAASPSDQRKMARDAERYRQRYAAAVDDLFRIYDIRMIRREAIDGHDTIFTSLTPRPNVKPRTDDGKVMRHFKARAWVSESDYELVRVELEAIDTLGVGLGLLARIHKGTTATYQRRKVNGEVWLPAEVTWTASARVLLLRRLRVRGVSAFSGYRKYSVNTGESYTTPTR